MEKISSFKHLGILYKGDTMNELIILLMQARTLFHVLHLKSFQQEEHIAVGELYDALPALIDGLAEQFQGRTKQLLDLSTFPAFKTNEADVCRYVEEVRSQILEIKDSGFDGDNSTTQNLIDGILEAFDDCVYKLTFLK